MAPLLLLVLTLALGTRPTPLDAATFEHHTLAVGGTTRAYSVLRPRAEGPLPAVFLLQGALQDPIDFVQLTGFPAQAEREGFVLVVPETFDGHWNDGRRIVYFGTPAMADDVGFLDRLMADLVTSRTIRADAVFLAGFSNGGLMALTLACRRGDIRPAGLVIAAATLRTSVADACSAPHPLAMVVVNGTADPLFPFGGGMGMVNGRTGELMMSASATADHFAAGNGCGARHDQIVGPPISLSTYADCPRSGPVLSFGLIDGGHLWPADASPAFGAAAGLDHPATLSELAWTIFRARLAAGGDQLPGVAPRMSTSPPVAPASTP